jgi:hypothetical protein
MNLIEALKTCKETGGKIFKESWMGGGGEEKDYTIPSYIYWNSNEEAFVAVFAMDASTLPDVYARIPEDYMGGVEVSSFSVSDILAEDWEIFGGATFANCF